MLGLKTEEGNDCACRALAHFLLKPGHVLNEAVRSFLLRDLCWRIPELEPLERVLIMAEVLSSTLPEDVRTAFPREFLKLEEYDLLRQAKKEHKDIGIITVIGTELRAVLVVSYNS